MATPVEDTDITSEEGNWILEGLLAIGCWLLAVGYWLLAIGYWLLAIGITY